MKWVIYAKQYVEITGYVFSISAINRVYSILGSTGADGLLLYVKLIISPTKRRNVMHCIISMKQC